MDVNLIKNYIEGNTVTKNIDEAIMLINEALEDISSYPQNDWLEIVDICIENNIDIDFVDQLHLIFPDNEKLSLIKIKKIIGQKNFRDAVRLLKLLVDKGSNEAKYELVKIYLIYPEYDENNKYLKMYLQDLSSLDLQEESIQKFKQSDIENNLEKNSDIDFIVNHTKLILGDCYLNGIYFDKNIYKAEKLLLATNHQSVNRSLGLLYLTKESFEMKSKGVQYLNQALRDNIPSVNFDLGICYLYGDGVSKDIKKAKELFDKGRYDRQKYDYYIKKYHLEVEESKKNINIVLNITVWILRIFIIIMGIDVIKTLSYINFESTFSTISSIIEKIVIVIISIFFGFLAYTFHSGLNELTSKEDESFALGMLTASFICSLAILFFGHNFITNSFFYALFCFLSIGIFSYTIFFSFAPIKNKIRKIIILLIAVLIVFATCVIKYY